MTIKKLNIFTCMKLCWLMNIVLQVVAIVQSISCFLATNAFIGKICGTPVGGGGWGYYSLIMKVDCGLWSMIIIEV